MEGIKKFDTNDVQFSEKKMSKRIIWLILFHLYVIDIYIYIYISCEDIACVVRDTTCAALLECRMLELLQKELNSKISLNSDWPNILSPHV